MSELRLNLVTRDWVIIATERAKRPLDFRREEDKPPIPPRMDTCPFCPGNEGKTGEELFRKSDAAGWKLRVVSNKYQALSREGSRRRFVEGTKRMISGVGLHEVIIESPVHNATLALMDLVDVENVLRVYRDRFVEAYKDERVEHVIIFKNYGERAGTSIVHPHTQLTAIPVVPTQLRDRVQSDMHYFDDTGECVKCDMIKMERNDGARVIEETEHFFTFVPYAALSPFHTWVFPKRHAPSFSDITENEIKGLARSIKGVLLKFYTGLEDPDYNLVVRSSRPLDVKNEYSHWYLSVIPRVSSSAGFELGSGMFINPSIPEEITKFLRSIKA